MTEELLLKWGTLKGWNLKSKASKTAAKKYQESGFLCGAAMMQHDNDAQKQALCDLIDAIDGEIINDWSGETMTKAQAKKYVMEWRR